MPTELIRKPILATGMIMILISFLCISYLHEMRSTIFKLSLNQIKAIPIKTTVECDEISECKLLPGDILIRRYITDRTWLFDKLIHPYFTHSAFYLGDNKIIEAIGSEKDQKDEIQMATLSSSDWFTPDSYSFAIIRPNYINSSLNTIKLNLVSITEDDEYTFGLPKPGQKRTTCADLIFQQLVDQQMIEGHDMSRIITPDYLYWKLIQKPENFQIIGIKIGD